MGEQVMDLLTSQNSGQSAVIFGADLGENGPVWFAEQIDKAHFSSGDGLANGLGFPVLLEFDEKEVVAQLGLGDEGGITADMFVDEPDLAIIGMASAIGIEAESQKVRQLIHGGVRVVIIDRVG